MLLDLLDHRNARVRVESAAALGRLRDHRVVLPLCRLLLTDVDENVRANSAVALGEIGDVRAVPHLRRANEEDTSEFVRRCAELAMDVFLRRLRFVGSSCR